MKRERVLTLAKNRKFCDELPPAARSDLAALASAVKLFVSRFPAWMAYLADANPDDTSPGAIRAVKKELRQVEEALASTKGVEPAVAKEFRSEVLQGTGPQADSLTGPAVIATTNELSRSLAKRASEEQRKRRNLAWAQKGGELYDKTVLAPIGIGLHLMLRLEGPLRSLSKRFPNRMGWIDAWYDATFPPKDSSPNP